MPTEADVGDSWGAFRINVQTTTFHPKPFCLPRYDVITAFRFTISKRPDDNFSSCSRLRRKTSCMRRTTCGI